MPLNLRTSSVKQDAILNRDGFAQTSPTGVA